MMQLILYLFILFSGSNKTNEDYVGKLTLSTHIGEIPLFEDREAYLYKDYLLEKTYTIKMVDTAEIDVKTLEITPKSHSQKDSLDGYVLTNLKTQEGFKFDNSETSPSLIKRYKVSERNEGFNFNIDNNKYYKLNLDKLKTADSTIHNQHFVLIKGIGYKAKTQQGDSVVIPAIAYLNKDLKNFPVNMSAVLAKKHNGFVSRIETISVNPNDTNKKISVVLKYEFTPGLSEKEINLVKKYRALAEK